MPRPLAVALAVLALLAAGCGDDDGPDAAPDVTTAEDEAAPDEDDGAEVPADTATDEDPEGSSTTTAPDAAAEDPPGSSGGADEGMGDPFVYVADLQAADVPGGGDAGATGRVEIRAADGQLCTDLEVTGLGSEVTDAHVHEGAAGEVGDVVLLIGPPTGGAGETATWDDVCVPDDGLARRLDTDASLFHADVHTRSHADGAVRGQLGYATIFDLTLP